MRIWKSTLDRFPTSRSAKGSEMTRLSVRRADGLTRASARKYREGAASRRSLMHDLQDRRGARLEYRYSILVPPSSRPRAGRAVVFVEWRTRREDLRVRSEQLVRRARARRWTMVESARREPRATNRGAVRRQGSARSVERIAKQIGVMSLRPFDDELSAWPSKEGAEIHRRKIQPSFRTASVHARAELRPHLPPPPGPPPYLEGGVHVDQGWSIR